MSGVALKLLFSFNSMKVRLKPYGSADASHAAAFQFHEGPIKTFSQTTLADVSIMFQFHEGPIKTFTKVATIVAIFVVSIP